MDSFACSVIRLTLRNTHSVVHFVQILFLFFFISFSLFQSSYAAAKGHIVLKCRANIKGITATLVAIRANENFGEGRPAVWVWLRTS